MCKLWFDVGIKRYTTKKAEISVGEKLWFDVGIKRYTTFDTFRAVKPGCGLM